MITIASLLGNKLTVHLVRSFLWHCTHSTWWMKMGLRAWFYPVYSYKHRILFSAGLLLILLWPSVESPSKVDLQWNIWYWGSKWNLHTVCWDAVGCELGTTSVYFGITYVCFIPSRLPVFVVEPQYRHQYFFIFVKSIIWRTYTKYSKNFMLFSNLNGVCRTNTE